MPGYILGIEACQTGRRHIAAYHRYAAVKCCPRQYEAENNEDTSIMTGTGIPRTLPEPMNIKPCCDTIK
ncbi:hypothetical protein [Desulfotruncus arcticus]|uniref:hypothetical protein n=1 Tax=Desulfotruncus arcticus TaxID=341036 RepID=UPI000B892BBC|nr:hypothetical protein [Desulfotruncus arcticus]